MKNKMIQAAMERTFDLVVKNIRFVNLFTREIYKAELGIADGRIAHVTQPGEPSLQGATVYDGDEKFVIPGFIDSHVHIESSMMNPANFARAVLPRGTTTVMADPHEIANVLGTEGVDYMIEAARGLPLSIKILAPACLPSALGLETNKACFTSKEIDELMSRPEVLGLGEVMDFEGVINQSDRISQSLSRAAAHNKFLQGHAPGLTGNRLSAYLAAGIESDHETHELEEALYKLRAGMVVECRYGSHFQDLPAIAPALIQSYYPGNATICTDDRDPDDLYSLGHIDEAVRAAIRAGIIPIEAIKLVTLNAARLGRMRDRGVLTPGRRADFLLLSSLEAVQVDEVFVEGRLIAHDGKMIEDWKAPMPVAWAGSAKSRCSDLARPAPEIEKRNTIFLSRPPALEDFRIKSPVSDGRVGVKALRFNEKDLLITKMERIEVLAKDGFLDLEGNPDTAVLAILERHGINGNRAAVPVKNLGIKKGAIASTVAHDCHNLFVAGKSPADMLLAANIIRDCGGGIVCVENGRVLELLELPIAGLMSPLPVEELAPKVAGLKARLKEMGIPGHSQLIMISFFALPVIPEARITDYGLVDVLTQRVIPLFEEI